MTTYAMAEWDKDRAYRVEKLGIPKSRPWSVRIIVCGEPLNYSGEFSTKAQAIAHMQDCAAGRF